jgi:hypothetical protein
MNAENDEVLPEFAGLQFHVFYINISLSSHTPAAVIGLSPIPHMLFMA